MIKQHLLSPGYKLPAVRNLAQNLQVNPSTVVNAYKELEKNGFITSYFGTETNGKRRTYYKITGEGIRYYQEKCQEWQITKEVVDKFIKEM